MAPKMGYLLKKKKKGKQAICLKQMVQGRVQISYRKNRDHLQIVSEKVQAKSYLESPSLRSQCISGR